MAWDDAGNTIALKGPKHRAVLARLIVARRRVVPVSVLVDDLWRDPPADPIGTVRTFVAALRRSLEPSRPSRAPAQLLVTEGPGYALRAEPDAVDAWRFEQASDHAQALREWRGPAYADFADEPWARADRRRLADLRLHAVEQLAEARLADGQAAEVAAELDAYVAEHPWRENAWRLLALALYRSGRQGDALAVLRRARTTLARQLGIDPGPELRKLEADVLAQASQLDPGSADVWARTTAAYDRAVPSGARARLESTVGLLRTLAVTGGNGLLAAREHRVAAIAAAEELVDADLTARVIGAYDVPAIWTRVDDPQQVAQVVAAAERVLPSVQQDAARARLLATIALESRGTVLPRGPEAAAEAESIARRLDDPALLAFALNAVFMQSFDRGGLAPRRARIGAELVALSAQHGLTAYGVLGHLIQLQARSALSDFAKADQHAAAADRLAARHELPLVGVFTGWYAALRTAATGSYAAAEAAYVEAAGLLDGAGMPGLERGLLPLALLCLRVQHGLPVQTEPADWGPYEPWASPGGGPAPDPPRDLLFEALWCLAAQNAIAVDDLDTMKRAYAALRPAAGELAGAGSGLLTVGPVARHLEDLAAALR
jgi:DNA-binding SARP family transcriptional activator